MLNCFYTCLIENLIKCCISEVSWTKHCIAYIAVRLAANSDSAESPVIVFIARCWSLAFRQYSLSFHTRLKKLQAKNKSFFDVHRKKYSQIFNSSRFALLLLFNCSSMKQAPVHLNTVTYRTQIGLSVTLEMYGELL